jgi:hypothetical protein
MFSDYVLAGGNLVAMRPDKQLADLLGLTDQAATLANAYLAIDTTFAAWCRNRVRDDPVPWPGGSLCG